MHAPKIPRNSWCAHLLKISGQNSHNLNETEPPHVFCLSWIQLGNGQLAHGHHVQCIRQHRLKYLSRYTFRRHARTTTGTHRYTGRQVNINPTETQAHGDVVLGQREREGIGETMNRQYTKSFPLLPCTLLSGGCWNVWQRRHESRENAFVRGEGIDSSRKAGWPWRRREKCRESGNLNSWSAKTVGALDPPYTFQCT